MDIQKQDSIFCEMLHYPSTFLKILYFTLDRADIILNYFSKLFKQIE